MRSPAPSCKPLNRGNPHPPCVRFHAGMSADSNLATVPDAATGAGCSERFIWYRLARGDLARHRSLGRTFVDVDQLHDLIAPRPD